MSEPFNMVMYTNARGIDTRTVHNQVRIPLIQSLARGLAQDGKLLVVTHYVSLPTAPFRESSRLVDYLRHSRLRRDGQNLWVYTPCVPLSLALARRVPCAVWLCRCFLQAQLDRVLDRLGFAFETPRVVWASSPFHIYYQGLVRERVTVYDCYDDYSIIGGGRPKLDTVQLEKEYVRRVDVVLAAATRQLERLQPLNDHAHYFPNAVDFHFFHQAASDGIDVAPVLADVPKPIIGLMGGISNWYDFPVLQEIISSRRDWTYVFIGQLYPSAMQHVRTLSMLPNFRFLGWQKFEDLPRFLKGFDVAIMPYRLNDLGHSVHPDKMYQYMAAGIPIVSTPVREVAQFGDVVELATGSAEFCAAIERSLRSKNSLRVRKGLEVAQRESWESRADVALRLIRQQLAQQAVSS